MTRTMHVYHRGHAGRPIRVTWTLEELGEPYELTVMSQEEGRSEEHRVRHPLLRVPVLDDGSGYVFESAAICMHLADMHPEAGLMPALGSHDRALAYQWTCFAPAEIEPALIETATYAQSDLERSALARERFDAAVGAVSEALDGHSYLVGESFSIADVLVGSALAFSTRGGLDDHFPQNLKDYVTRLSERPACKRATERMAH